MSANSPFRLDIKLTPEWPFLASAAVLTSFDAERLRPLGGGKANLGRVATMLVQYGEPVAHGPHQGRWCLSEGVRRQVLGALSSAGLLQDALSANHGNQMLDTTQQALAELVHARGVVDLSGRSLEQLLGMEQALDWLRGTNLRGLLDRRFVLAQIERHMLLEPLRRLIAGGFEGRTRELAELRAYVDHLPSGGMGETLVRAGTRLLDVFRDRPLIVVYGPGGSGKSTIIAKFVMDHAGSHVRVPMPFVYLDFDSVGLMPPNSDRLLAEALRQLRVQFPDSKSLGAGEEDARRRPVEADQEENRAKSDRYEQAALVREELTGLLNRLATHFSQNILFVLDTFEVVQRRGATAVFTVIRAAADLLVACPRLRIVVIGRSNLRREDFPFSNDVPTWESRPLSGFDAASGRAYLTKRLELQKVPVPPPVLLDRVVSLVRGNALGLRLAATVLAREGVAGVEGAIGRQRLDEKIAQEQIQGFLHERIVEHLDNPQLRQLADPGLIVRRITAPVIERVLAAVCDIRFDDEHTPAKLLAQLGSEVALVETLETGALRHRTDVRLLMLPLLRRKLGAKARQIDEAAIRYWSGEAGPAARAEEIYHRLWCGEDGADIEPRWLPEAAPFLEDALDEFLQIAPNRVSCVWLASKLNRELPVQIRKNADQLNWERDTLKKARTLVAASRLDEALTVMRERPMARRTATSPLWLVEIDALLLKGRTAEAKSVAGEAIGRLAGEDDPAHLYALLTRQVSICERLNDLTGALETAGGAAALADDMRDRVLIFTSDVTLARLWRKSGKRYAPEVAAVHARLASMIQETAVWQALAENPSLLREAAAEIGAHHPVLLAEAVERLGLWSTARAETIPIPDSVLKILHEQGQSTVTRGARSLERRVAELLRSPEETVRLQQEVSALLAAVVDHLNTQTLK